MGNYSPDRLAAGIANRSRLADRRAGRLAGRAASRLAAAGKYGSGGNKHEGELHGL